MQFLPADLLQALSATRRRWLVTGAAGFIGSNLVECLLQAGQDVVGLEVLAPRQPHDGRLVHDRPVRAADVLRANRLLGGEGHPGQGLHDQDITLPHG